MHSNLISGRGAAFLAAALLAILTVVPAAHAQNTVGTITQLQGTASIQRAGATIAAAVNMPVLLHDKITTDPNGSLTLGLVDNSSLQLGASSTMTIDGSLLVNGVGAPSQVGLLGGHLHSIIVGAMRGSTTTFQVNTPNAVGAVRGTGWSEDYTDQQRQGFPTCLQYTDVDVDEGTVQLCTGPSCTNKECRDVQAGHHLTLACCAFFEGGAAGGVGALGTAGAIGLGVGLAAGVGVGIAAGAGAFSGGGSSSTTPPATPSK
jgi:hypothetical protein